MSRTSIGELKIIGNTRTKDKVIRREAVMAGLLPGEMLDKNRLDIVQKRLQSLGYFHIELPRWASRSRSRSSTSGPRTSPTAI